MLALALALAGVTLAGCLAGPAGETPEWPAEIDLAPLGVNAYGEDLRLSENGVWVALSGAFSGSGTNTPVRKLIRADLSAGKAEVADQGDFVRTLAISSDGTRVLYFKGEVYRRLERSVLNLPAEGEPFIDTSFSPDGGKMAFLSLQPSSGPGTGYDQGQARIWVAGADGGAARPLTTEPGLYSAPFWARGGAKVVTVLGSPDQSTLKILLLTAP